MPDTSIPDHEYLTVKELAELLRLKERKIYHLAASGAVPCSRATGKLLFPAAEVRAWIEQARSGGTPGVTGTTAARPPIILGSHDPLLDWAVRQSRCGLATYYDGSRDGLDRFVQREGVATSLHIYDAEADAWNVPAVEEAVGTQDAALISFARRQRGLVFQPGKAAPSGLSDLAGLRFVPRQQGSGSDILFQALAEQAGLDLSLLELAQVARTEDEAVETVRRSEADVAFGLEAVARTFGLEFTPVTEESFALVVDRKAWFDPQMQMLLRFCKTDEFLSRARSLGGYDTSALGTVVWNA